MSMLLAEREYTAAVKDLLNKSEKDIDSYHGKSCGMCEKVRTIMSDTLQMINKLPDPDISRQIIEERE